MANHDPMAGALAEYQEAWNALRATVVAYAPDERAEAAILTAAAKMAEAAMNVQTEARWKGARP